MVFGRIKKVERNGKIYKYCYVLRTFRKDKKYPEEKVVKYFGTNFEGFVSYLEEHDLLKGAVVEHLEDYFNQQ